MLALPMILTCPRYLTENEITIIAQDYRHGTGYAGRRRYATSTLRLTGRPTRLEFWLRYFFWRLEMRPRQSTVSGCAIDLSQTGFADSRVTMTM